MDIKEAIQKSRLRIEDIETRTNNLANKALRKALLLSFNENLLKKHIINIENNFLKSGVDYTVLKLFVENYRDLRLDYRNTLQNDIAKILDENATTKDFVSKFYENGFLVVFIKSKENEIKDYLSAISSAISNVLQTDRNIPRISQSIMQRNRHLDKRDEFLEVVLNR